MLRPEIGLKGYEIVKKNKKKQEIISGEIEIKIIRSAPGKDLARLYEQAGWLDSSPDGQNEFLKDIVNNSAVFMAAFDGKKMVGMGRALSDQVSDAYVQDVTVLKPYRKMGIGERIVRSIVQHLKKKGVDWIGLVAEPGTLGFYEKLGFKQMKGYLPVKYEDQE